MNMERLGKLIISLLQIAVPTILILIVLILYINSRSRHIMDELAEIRTQLEKKENVSAVSGNETDKEIQAAVPERIDDVPECIEEKQDAEIEQTADIEASAYNTGKSGKIYTKEELELLIRE